MRIDSRTVRRRSGERPERAPAVRRVRRFGGVSRILAMIRRTAASSSGVQAANDLCLRASASDGHQAERRLFLLPVRARIGGRNLKHRLSLRRHLGPERQHLTDRVGGVEEVPS